MTTKQEYMENVFLEMEKLGAEEIFNNIHDSLGISAEATARTLSTLIEAYYNDKLSEKVAAIILIRAAKESFTKFAN